MAVFEITNWQGGISVFNDKGGKGSAKHTANVDIRKERDSLSCGQALKDEGILGASRSVSSSKSPSQSVSPSRSNSASASPSHSPSLSQSPSASASRSASASASPSGSQSSSRSASPSPSPSAGLFNVFEDLILFFVKCTDGNTYGVGNTGFVYRRLPGGYWTNVYRAKDQNGQLLGAIIGFEEKPSAGAAYLYMITNNHILRKPIPGNSDWNDVETVASNLDGQDWHTTKQIGGALHIANGSKLALVGYDDSYTPEALSVIPGNIIKTLVERNGRAVLGTVKAWDINKGANAMIDTEQPLVQIGNNGDLFFANFIDSMPIRRFPGGGKVNPGGVCNEIDQVGIFDWEQGSISWIDKQSLGNMSLWGVFNADINKNGVFSYGRKNKEQPITMNLEYALEVDEIGAIISTDDTLLISYRSGSEFGVKSIDYTQKATGVFESLEFRAPIKKAEEITVFGMTEIYMEALPEGCNIQYFYKLDHAVEWTQAKAADGADNYAKTNGKKATFKIGQQGDVFEEKIVLTPNGNVTAEVLRSRTYFN